MIWRDIIPPDTERNYYDEFSIVPHGLMEKLRLSKMLACNWHALNRETDEQLAKKNRVDKRGAKSDKAYVRELLQDIASAHSPEFLLAQFIGLIERFTQAGRIVISPQPFNQDEFRLRLILTLTINKLVQHIWEEIRFENTQALTPVFDTEKPILRRVPCCRRTSKVRGCRRINLSESRTTRRGKRRPAMGGTSTLEIPTPTA